MKSHWLARAEPAPNEWPPLATHPQIKGSVSLLGMTGIQTEITIPVHDISLLSLPHYKDRKFTSNTDCHGQTHSALMREKPQ